MDELQRAKFILSTPLCSQIKCALELLTGIKYSTSDNPFDERNELLNVDSGEIAEQNVSVYNSL